MSKLLIITFFTAISLASITGCDKNTAQKTDQAVEAVDAKVEQLAKTPNILQPAAKNADATVNAIHSTVHTPSNPTKASSQ